MTAVWPRCSVPSASVEIERCDELRSVVRRFMHAYASADADAAINLMLPSEHLSMVGTDGAEWYLGFDSISRIVRAQSVEVEGSQFTELESHAWTTGDTGWVTARYRALFPNGYEGELRMTMILVLHRGDWRIVHSHASIAMSNEEAVGFAVTTSIDAIVDAVADEHHDVSDLVNEGLVTVVFSDIESSTALAERLGDTAWVELLGRYDRRVRDLVGRRRGRVVKAMGDGYMLVFPSVRQGLACALDLQAIDFDGVRTRVGVHAGEAVTAADDFFGHSVTMAARVASAADGGEVLVSDVVCQLVAGFREFEFSDARIAVLKGIDGEHIVRRVALSTSSP